MSEHSVWMLLAAGGKTAVAAPLRARIGFGTRGEGLRRVDVRDGGPDMRESAALGAQLAYELLYREKYLDRRVTVAFGAEAELANVHGRSADLAFALAFVAGVRGADGSPNLRLPLIAATGVLNHDGGILPVDHLTEKLLAALTVLPSGASIAFPRANEAELTPSLRREAAQRNIILAPAARFDEVLRQAGVDLSQTWDGSPFRGLAPFEFEHAAVFFGREKEIEDVISLAHRRVERNQNAILIEGPSGSGKSSLVLAGVIPALLRRGMLDSPGTAFHWGVLRPRDVKANFDPSLERAALAEALQNAWRHNQEGGLGPREMIASVDDALDATTFWRWLREGAPEVGGPAFILVLDQMDEWFDGPLQPSTIDLLSTSLASLSSRGVLLIATLTKGGFSRLGQYPALNVCFGVEGRYALAQQLGAARLETVIRGPARAARLEFDAGLDAEIVAAANQGGADVLPLLAMLLTELYERRDQVRNVLRMEDYRAVGGLDGVISSRAELIFDDVARDAQSALPEFLWKLHTAGELFLSDYPDASPMRGLIDAFQLKRLLVKDDGAHGDVSARVAHEALLRNWERAAVFRRTELRDIKLWLDLMREAGQWARGERALIPTGPQLQAAHALHKRRLSEWTPSDSPAVAYVRASYRQLTRRRTILGFAVGVPALAAGAAGAQALLGYFERRRETRIDFSEIPVGSPDYAVAAAPYLHSFGISVLSRAPDNSHLLIKSNSGLYEGQAASPYAGEHFLTQEALPPVAPISYTLGFERPPKAISIVRAGLWAATPSGVSHPAWSARALDGDGAELAQVAEGTSARFNEGEEIPPKTYVVRAGGDRRIARLEITSDFRDDRGRPYAGFQAVLIKEIRLIH